MNIEQIRMGETIFKNLTDPNFLMQVVNFQKKWEKTFKDELQALYFATMYILLQETATFNWNKDSLLTKDKILLYDKYEQFYLTFLTTGLLAYKSPVHEHKYLYRIVKSDIGTTFRCEKSLPQ